MLTTKWSPKPVDIGVQDFCESCRLCETNCPAQALSAEKTVVRGYRKWPQDYNKCFGFCELMGINIVRLKIGAFGLGAFIAGVAGGLFAHYYLYIEPEFFNVWKSIYMVLFVIMGGMLTFWGSVMGAAIFTLLPEFTRVLHDWRGAFFGLVIIVLMIIRPSGILTRDMFSREFWRPSPKEAKP